MSKAPWPLRLLSYLAEIPVSRHSSQYSPELKVSIYRGRYMLSVNQVVYSFEDEYTSFKRAFGLLKPKAADVKSLLVLGYGLGSVPAILSARHGIHPAITAVDIDPVILKLAEQYSPLPDDARVNYIAADAGAFIQVHDKRYDMVAIDLFIDDHVPLTFQTPEFLKQVTERLNPGGLLLFNWLYADETQQQATDTYYREVFEQNLPGAFTIETGGNLVLRWKKE